MSEYTSIKETVLQLIAENLSEIRERFGIETIGVFGSVSRGEDTADSDVDILYEFVEDKATLRNLLDLKEYLSSLFGREVDLIPAYLTPVLKPYLQKDAILYGAQTVIA